MNLKQMIESYENKMKLLENETDYKLYRETNNQLTKEIYIYADSRTLPEITKEVAELLKNTGRKDYVDLSDKVHMTVDFIYNGCVMNATYDEIRNIYLSKDFENYPETITGQIRYCYNELYRAIIIQELSKGNTQIAYEAPEIIKVPADFNDTLADIKIKDAIKNKKMEPKEILELYSSHDYIYEKSKEYNKLKQMVNLDDKNVLEEKTKDGNKPALMNYEQLYKVYYDVLYNSNENTNQMDNQKSK